MTSSEIRKRFLDYFAEKGHEVVPSSSLLPKGDPTLLFTNAGMVQFKGVFLGEEKRGYKRAATVQKCVRAGGKHNDLENVGQTARHHTFFEMLGNFSFGDYFKEGAIEYAWEFLTDVMKLPKEKIWITVYTDDDEAAGIWATKIGVPAERIVRLGEAENFWAMGETGPCGPCSEIHLDQGSDVGCGRPECNIECDCGRFLEIWNLVFMQYNRSESGELTPLAKPSIDTGMGLERLSAVMQGKPSNYDTDIFTPLIKRIEQLSGVKYGTSKESDVSIRAIADHARAVTFLITDGILPSNEGRGYVLRRILRRAARHGKMLGLTKPFLYQVSEHVIKQLTEAYPEIERAKETVIKATRGEEERFLETLDRGLEILDDEIEKIKGKERVLSGKAAFRLYDTYGFPLDLTADIIKGRGLTVDEEGFNSEMEAQRERARSAWKGSGEVGASEMYKKLAADGVKSAFVGYHMEAASSKVVSIIKGSENVESAKAGDTIEIVTEETPFYGESGGQTGDSGVMVKKGVTVKVTDTKKPVPDLIVHQALIEEGTLSVGDEVELVPDKDQRDATRRNHTATHILHAKLRETLGDHVRQAGSLVTPKGLRFDFNHFEAVGADALAEIERAANLAVMKNVEVVTDELAYDEAIKRGALAFFDEKYADKVRMVDLAGVSTELCGGTHVTRSGDIGPIKITSESSVAAGVRRIEALTGQGAIEAVKAEERLLKEAAGLLKSSPKELPERIRRLIEEEKEAAREIAKLKSTETAGSVDGLLSDIRDIGGAKVLAAKVEGADAKELRDMADRLRAKLGSGVVVLASGHGGKAMLLAAVTKDLCEKYPAGEIVKRLAPIVGGKGGGRADMAQAGGKDVSKLDDAVAGAYALVEEMAG